jgi:hypothetical protein
MAYHYTPLNENNTEIRLIRLLPGKRKDAIHILIEHEPFTDDHIPEYEALSYTWGDPNDRANIFVGPSRHLHRVRKAQRHHRSHHGWTALIGRYRNFRNMWREHTLSVTKNLAEALTYLRRQDLPRVFWIDAISVNQADLDERSRQVSLMASLYSHARTVIVWLGPEAQDSGVAFSFIELLSKTVFADWLDLSITCLTDDERWADKELPPPFGDKELVALQHIFNRPWFERLWVWQEVRLGGERAMVQCGDRLLKWPNFPNALLWFNRQHVIAHRHLYKPSLGALCICNPRSYSLCGFLAQARTLKCQDPRDKVFAVLSLPGPQSLLYVHVDYSKRTSEVYTDAVTAWLSRYHALDMLGYIITPQLTPNLPSWVPDWAMGHTEGADQQFHMASCSSSSRAVWENHENRLKVTGKFIGTIKVIQHMPTEMSEEVSLANCDDFLKGISAEDGSFRQFVTTLDGLEALCRTLCAGIFADYREPIQRDYPFLQETVAALAEALRVPNRMMDEDYYLNYFYRRFWNMVGRVCGRRGLVLLENGLLGIAPANAMPGDRVSVLLGCRSAMVVRSAGEDAFQVIGSAYIDGFMHGEAILGSLPARITPVMRYAATGGGGYHPAFRNEENGEISSEDPRLGPLPPGWRRHSEAFAGFWPMFENEDTGDMRTYLHDPRCDLENLTARGMELRTVELV